MKKMIEVKGLTKSYGKVKVVDNLSFEALEGDIVGLIGPNGAGKSTVMCSMLKLIHKDQGDILIQGENIDTVKKRNVDLVLGFTSESPSFYEYLSGYENLKLIANLYKEIDDKRIEEMLQFINLEHVKYKKVSIYSTGMKQRLGLARALIHKPKVVILDEPTNGLDPQGMHDIYSLIKKMAIQEKITVLISSHLLHDVEKICNKVIIINHGKAIYSGDINHILDKGHNLYHKKSILVLKL